MTTTVCSVRGAIELIRPELGTLFRNHCIKYMPDRRYSGVTIFIPEDIGVISADVAIGAASRDEIRNTLQPLVLPGFLPTDQLVAEIERADGAVASMLRDDAKQKYRTVQLTVKDGKPGFKAGSKFVELVEYRLDRPEHSSFALYAFKSKSLPPLNDGAVEIPKYAVPRPRVAGGVAELNPRQKHWYEVLDSFRASGYPYRALQDLVSVIEWLKAVKPEGAISAAGAAELVCANPFASWYILFQPFRKKPAYLPDAAYRRWRADTGCHTSVSDIFARYESYAAKDASPLAEYHARRLKKEDIADFVDQLLGTFKTLGEKGVLKVGSKSVRVVHKDRCDVYSANPGLFASEALVRLRLYDAAEEIIAAGPGLNTSLRMLSAALSTGYGTLDDGQPRGDGLKRALQDLINTDLLFWVNSVKCVKQVTCLTDVWHRRASQVELRDECNKRQSCFLAALRFFSAAK